MNKLIINAVIATLLLVISLPMSVIGQEKKVHIKTVKVVDGEKVVNDTIFVVKEGEDEREAIKTITWISDDDDSSEVITVDVDIDTDVDFDKDYEKGDHRKVIIMKSGDDGEKIIMLEELKELEELHELKELENIEIIMPEIHSFPEHYEYAMHMHDGNDNVSDKELRDAGIKNKADRLDVNNYNLNIDNGVVDLDFILKTEGDPKVTVFNYFGDKVFSGKPELMGGKYVIKIDLSNKQRGTYYLQVVQKNSSFTKKLRL